MLVAIGSKNPAKIKAVEDAFSKHSSEISFTSFETESGVSDQPFSDEETITGALNRAESVLGLDKSADIGVGLEGGVVDTEFGMFLCNWGALVTREGARYIAGGARILLPEEVAIPLREGSELGPIMDAYTKQKGIRHKAGAIGIFTAGEITRDEMFQHVVSMLLGQWRYQQK